jgi:Skp family chaperone for outer membrane proteins
MKTLALLALLLALRGLPARAVEVSLEENKAAKGGVAFVDMKQLFRLFPETQKAKRSFEDSMHQSEEQINLRRAELLGLRAEIGRLKAERDAAEKASAAPAAPNLPGTEVARSTAPAAAPSASPADRLAALDKTIADKSRILAEKDADFKTFESKTEKGLLDLEGRKTEALLGRIYAAIQETAKDENVSIVLDKSQILFGHKGVDLTDKVAQRLKSQNP